MTILISKLRSVNSTIEKQRILHYALEEDKKLFKWTYDPFKRYKLHYDFVDMDRLGVVREEMFTILAQLSSGKLSGNNARAVVDKYCEAHGDLIKLVCNKDLDCGVSAITLNKVYGKHFIPKFFIQLAMEEEIEKVVFPVLGQLKYNGARVLVIVENGLVTFKSRGGHEFCFPKLEEIIKAKISKLSAYVLDGELTFGDSKNEDHTKVSGIINSSIKGTPISSNLDLVYHVFDCLPLKDFNSLTCTQGYMLRRENIKAKVEEYSSDYIKIAKTNYFSNKEELEDKYELLIKEGYEGLILKQPNHTYTYKKNKTWIKMKVTDTADLLCISYVEGTGKYDGAIGSLVCTGTVEGKYVSVCVGSGLTDEDRSIDPQKYIGKTIEVAYNKVIVNSKTSSWSLFLPRFKQVRSDK